jgi:DNA anti-recombination protein RmuC
LSGGVQKKQQEEWELAVTQLKSKLEASEELQIQLAASAAKTRSELESELERIRQTLSASQAELGRMRDEVATLVLNMRMKVNKRNVLCSRNKKLQSCG